MDISKVELVFIVFLVYLVCEKLEVWMVVVYDLCENLLYVLLVIICFLFFNEEVEVMIVKEYVDMVLLFFEEGLVFVFMYMWFVIKV